MFRDFFKQEEKRIDPEDGELRTKQELQAACAGLYSPEEVENYWNTQCKPMDQAGGEQHSVANDPFLTHVQAQERRPDGAPQAAAAEMTDLNANPFLTRAEQQQNEPSLRSDPFLTHDTSRSQQARPPAQAWPPARAGAWMDPQNQAALAATAQRELKHWTEVAGKMLGDGDPDRKPSARFILVIAPWAVFVGELLLWVLLRHFSIQATVVLTLIVYAASLSLIVLWQMGKRWGPISLLSLGVLLVFACTMGTVIGDIGWDHYWRENWWLHTGRRSAMNSATTPAGSQSDSAMIGFWDDGLGRTVNDTSVDSLKSAGFKDDHYYCVAPILNPDSAGANLAMVNYWAVGLDCCQYLGSFTCDDSRHTSGGYGAVMLEQGLPCPGCNSDKFKKAVLKAESMHGLVSAPGAVFVRWVASPSSVTAPSMLKSVFFIIIADLIALLVFNFLGSVTWYYGLGKRDSYAEPLLSGAKLWAKQLV